MSRSATWFCVTCLCLAGAIATPGCGMLPKGGLFSSQPEPPAHPASIVGDRVNLQVFPVEGNPRKSAVPLENGMLVGDVLKKTGLHRSFKRMTLQIVRRLPTGRVHRMDVEFDFNKRRVQPQFDYALYPNDTLVVKQVEYSPLDELLERFAGPLTERIKTAK